MQHVIQRVERPGESQKALDGKKEMLVAMVLDRPLADAQAEKGSSTSSKEHYELQGIPTHHDELHFFVRARCLSAGLRCLNLTRGPAGNRTTTGSLSATQECRDTN